MAAVSVQCRGAVLKTTVLLFSRSDGPEIDLFDPVGFSVEDFLNCENGGIRNLGSPPSSGSLREWLYFVTTKTARFVGSPGDPTNLNVF